MVQVLRPHRRRRQWHPSHTRSLLHLNRSLLRRVGRLTVASITYQSFFRLYKTLSGMSGTANTEAKEFADIYGLPVTCIPTALPVARRDNPDAVFRSLLHLDRSLLHLNRSLLRRVGRLTTRMLSSGRRTASNRSLLHLNRSLLTRMLSSGRRTESGRLLWATLLADTQKVSFAP